MTNKDFLQKLMSHLWPYGNWVSERWTSNGCWWSHYEAATHVQMNSEEIYIHDEHNETHISLSDPDLANKVQNAIRRGLGIKY